MITAFSIRAHLNKFHWTAKGLNYEDHLIIPHGEKWIHNVQDLRLTSLIRKDRPWEMAKDRDLRLNTICILR